MIEGFKFSNNKWNKNALGYGEKTNLSSKDDWNKNALKYDPKNDLENSGFSLKMTNKEMIIGIKMRVNMEKKTFL